MKQYSFHVSGTHCKSCKILIEDIVGEENGITDVHVNLTEQILRCNATEESKEKVLQRLAKKLEPHGYTLSNHAIKEDGFVPRVFMQAIPIGLLFLALFFLLQKSNILNFGIGGTISPVTSFLLGIIASLSSCLAIVGGLILSLSTTITEEGGGKKPLYLFHIGRLLGFLILGGVLGFIGKSIGSNYILSSTLGILAAVIMILLGLNLLGIFKKGMVTLPTAIFTFLRKVSTSTLAPLVLGVVTFFLPCGFTQSMQVATLGSGSSLMGALIMFFFALGTLPVLSLLSFGSLSITQSKHAPLFFASVGVIVIGLGLFSLLGGLAALGIIPPLFTL